MCGLCDHDQMAGNKHTDDHDKLIRDVAREHLGPMGLTQRGRSRSWPDDHGWWLIVVEFQPSTWMTGTYSNVGTDHLWCEKDYLALGGMERIRVEGCELIGFDPDEPGHFRSQLVDMVVATADAVMARRREHGVDNGEALARLMTIEGDIYDSYNAGVAAGLLGDTDRAQSAFTRVLDAEDDRAWVTQFKRYTEPLFPLLTDIPGFEIEVNLGLESGRSALRLPGIEPVWR